MTMVSFRVDEAEVELLRQWTERLGVDRSELLREALRRHLLRLAGEQDAEGLGGTATRRGRALPGRDRRLGARRGLIGLGRCYAVRSGSRRRPGVTGPCWSWTRDPVADRIGSVGVVALTRTHRGLVSELNLSAQHDRVPTDCVVNFDRLHRLAKESFRRRITALTPLRMAQACRVLVAATGC
jgi:mRNA interferase MazF